MKTELFTLLLGAFFIITAIIGLFLYLGESNDKLKKIGKIIGKTSLVFILMVYINFKMDRKEGTYYLAHEQEKWEKYSLPQIDSTMVLELATKSTDYYYSWSKDSILHHSKVVEYDLYDIYSITDEFINRKQGQIITSKFIKPNLLRDSIRIYTIEQLVKDSSKDIDTLTLSEFNNIMINWGLKNLYKKFEIR